MSILKDYNNYDNNVFTIINVSLEVVLLFVVCLLHLRAPQGLCDQGGSPPI